MKLISPASTSISSVLFEAVLRGVPCRPRGGSHEPHAVGRQPWARPAAPAAQRSAVPADTGGRRAHGTRHGAGRADRGDPGAGAERRLHRRAVRSRPIHAPVHHRGAGRRFGRVAAAAARRSCARARPASTSACVSCFRCREKCHPSAPGAPPSPSWRHAPWTSRSSPPTRSRRASICKPSMRKISSSRCARAIRSRRLRAWIAIARCSIWWSRSPAMRMVSLTRPWRSRGVRGGSR